MCSRHETADERASDPHLPIWMLPPPETCKFLLARPAAARPPSSSPPPAGPFRRHHRQPEGLEPVARARAHRLPGQGPQLAAWRLAPDHPAQVTLEQLHPVALAPPREVGE